MQILVQKRNGVIDKSAGGTIEVVFLKGTSDEANDSSKTIVRAKDVKGQNFNNQGIIAGQDAYIVHPAFCDGSGDGYPNGEWDAEITGFWMAKFEAGYAENKEGDVSNESKIKYTSVLSDVNPEIENENYYGNIVKNETLIKYPEFKGNRPSFNVISIGDGFQLCKELTAHGNPYGFSNQIDSHMVKNSEWSAVSYLSWSEYGTSGIEISINNVYAESKTITGCAGSSANDSALLIDFDVLLNDSERQWTGEIGEKSSTTGNITGIYDMSGGAWEMTTGVTFNNNIENQKFGSSVVDGGASKYVNFYSCDGEIWDNFLKNSFRIGNAIWDTSTKGTDYYAWNNDRSSFRSS